MQIPSIIIIITSNIIITSKLVRTREELKARLIKYRQELAEKNHLNDVYESASRSPSSDQGSHDLARSVCSDHTTIGSEQGEGQKTASTIQSFCMVVFSWQLPSLLNASLSWKVWIKLVRI